MKCFADLEDQNFHPLFCSRFLFTVEDMALSIIVGKRLSNLPQRLLKVFAFCVGLFAV